MPQYFTRRWNSQKAMAGYMPEDCWDYVPTPSADVGGIASLEDRLSRLEVTLERLIDAQKRHPINVPAPVDTRHREEPPANAAATPVVIRGYAS